MSTAIIAVAIGKHSSLCYASKKFSSSPVLELLQDIHE
jgi:hypothetical protein